MVSGLWDGILNVNTNVKEQVKTVKNVLKQFQNSSPSWSKYSYLGHITVIQRIKGESAFDGIS